MIPKQLDLRDLIDTINSLPGELFFFITDGPLKNKLIETYLEEDAHTDILEFELDASLRIKPTGSAGVPLIEGRLEADEFEYQTTFSVETLAGEEIVALLEYLNTQTPSPHQQAALLDKKILRKKSGSGLLNTVAAASILGLSHQSLKTLIPCSAIRVEEKDGNKTIEEYYWEKELIDRFVSLRVEQQEGRRPSHKDVTFIAEHCCEGDQQWARDCIADFLSE
jgi:hypothetical protein